jgi:hypothetical protein
MDKKKIIILDDSKIFYDFMRKCAPDDEIVLIDVLYQKSLLNMESPEIFLINTSIICEECRFKFERGGLEFIKTNINRFPKSSRIIFFSYEDKESIKYYLLDKWLKYDTKYFIHYPFEKDAVLKIINSGKAAPLKTTDMFKIEVRHNLLKLLSSVKHDFLNRIARILPDLKAYRSSFLNGGSLIEFDMDFKPDFLKAEIIKLSERIRENILRNEPNYDAAMNIALKEIAELLNQIPNLIILFRENREVTNDLLNDLEKLINSIEEIKQKFENIIGYLRDEQR